MNKSSTAVSRCVDIMDVMLVLLEGSARLYEGDDDDADEGPDCDCALLCGNGSLVNGGITCLVYSGRYDERRICIVAVPRFESITLSHQYCIELEGTHRSKDSDRHIVTNCSSNKASSSSLPRPAHQGTSSISPEAAHASGVDSEPPLGDSQTVSLCSSGLRANRRADGCREVETSLRRRGSWQHRGRKETWLRGWLL